MVESAGINRLKPNRATLMSTVRLRPTFVIKTDLDSTETMKRIGQILANNPDRVVGQLKTKHAVISIANRNRHFWSPCLNLDYRESDSGNALFGRFSPHPSIWTGLIFAYLSLGVLVFFSLILGLSQQLSGQSAWGYFLLAPWISIAVVLWLASQAGQRLSSDEMKTLKQLIENGIREPA